MKNALKYAVLALGPIVLIIGVVWSLSGGGDKTADSVLFYNVLTGESDRMSIADAGVSIRRDDQDRKVKFIVVGEDGNTNVSPGETMYIRTQERRVLADMVADGRLNADDLKVDLDTYMIVQ